MFFTRLVVDLIAAEDVDVILRIGLHAVGAGVKAESVAGPNACVGEQAGEGAQADDRQQFCARQVNGFCRE